MSRLKATKKIEARLAAAVEFVKASKHPVTTKELAERWILAAEYVALFLNEAVDRGLLFSDVSRLPHIYSASPLKKRNKPVVAKQTETLYADLAARLDCSKEEVKQRLLDLLVPRLKPRS